MPIQTVEHWEEKVRKAEEMAKEMSNEDSRQAMLEIAELYRALARQTAKLATLGTRKE